MTAVTSPFNWRAAPRQTTNNRKPTKPDLRPKGMHTFQKAVPATEGCYFCNDAEAVREAASEQAKSPHLHSVVHSK